MADALSHVEFLSRSPHRHEVLKALSEESRERASLQEQTGVSRVTISRTLEEMEERGWVAHEGWEYWITPFGELVAKKFAGLLEGLETVEKLNRVAQWLPLDAIGTELSHFSDAEITVASPANASAPIQAFAESVTEADRLRVLAYGVSPYLISHHQEVLKVTGQPFDIVLSAAHYDSLRENTQIAPMLREMARSEFGDYYRFDGDIPHHLLLTDRAVGLLLTDINGTFPAYVESRDEEVYSWGEGVFVSHLQESTPIQPTEFAVGE